MSLGQQFLDSLHLHLGVESQLLLIIHLHHELAQLLGVVGLEDLKVLLEAQVVRAQVIVVVLADAVGAYVTHLPLELLHQARQAHRVCRQDQHTALLNTLLLCLLSYLQGSQVNITNIFLNYLQGPQANITNIFLNYSQGPQVNITNIFLNYLQGPQVNKPHKHLPQLLTRTPSEQTSLASASSTTYRDPKQNNITSLSFLNYLKGIPA